jgi:hypothetical protein
LRTNRHPFSIVALVSRTPRLQQAAAANPSNAEVLTILGMALCLAQRSKDAVPLLVGAKSNRTGIGSRVLITAIPCDFIQYSFTPPVIYIGFMCWD